MHIKAVFQFAFGSSNTALTCIVFLFYVWISHDLICPSRQLHESVCYWLLPTSTYWRQPGVVASRSYTHLFSILRLPMQMASGFYGFSRIAPSVLQRLYNVLKTWLDCTVTLNIIDNTCDAGLGSRPFGQRWKHIVINVLVLL